MFRAGKKIDLALVDVRMPDLDGLELLRAIKAEWADVPGDHAVDLRERAVREARALRRRRRLPVEGRHARGPLAGDQRRDVGQRQRPEPSRDPEPVRGPAVRRTARTDGANEYSLTQRENDILALLAEGKSNREIAQSLFLSEKTVKAHLAAIFRKLGVTNRTQAAMMAVQMGVGPTPGALVIGE